MPLTLYPVTASFIAEIGDADLSRPLPAQDAQTLIDAFNRYSVLVFPAQHLDADQHLSFAQIFGPLEESIGKHIKDNGARIRTELSDVSNLKADGQIMEADNRMRMMQMGNRIWHTDSSFRRVPAKASLLDGRTIPPVGGHTEFADCRAAYDALTEAMKTRLEGLVAEHSLFTSRARLGFTDFSDEERAAMPPSQHLLVRTLAGSGRKSLYLAAHAGRIIGMPHAEGRALIDELIEHATQRQFVYSHRWRQHDLVIWDNRCTMHRGMPFDDQRWPRDMQRATVSDVGPTLAQALQPASANTAWAATQ